MKKLFKKLVIAGLILGSLLMLVVPHGTNAACTGLGFLNPLCLVGGLLEMGITIAIAIGGFIINIEAWALSIMLAINAQVVVSPVVEAGNPLMLSIANYFFIIALIVIGIATILRRSDYGYRQILWKVIVVAILINFGLTIAGAVVGVSDSFTKGFLTQLTGGGGYDLATKLTGVLQPHTFVLTGVTPTATSTNATTQLPKLEAGSLDSVIPWIASGIFALAGITITVITLGALVIMLLVRYIWLGILLTVLPLAWVAWIFPNLSKYSSQWWDLFIKWVFFPPIVLFFLWLGITTGAAMKNGSSSVLNMQTYTASGNQSYEGIRAFLGNFAPIVIGVITDFMQVTVVGAIMMGGIFAAEKFGIYGSAAAMGAASAAGAMAAGVASRQTRRLGTAVGGAVARPVGKGLAQIGSAVQKRKPQDWMKYDWQKSQGEKDKEKPPAPIATTATPGTPPQPQGAGAPSGSATVPIAPIKTQTQTTGSAQATEKEPEKSASPINLSTLKNTEEVPGAEGVRKDRDIADIQREERAQESGEKRKAVFNLAKGVGGWALNKVTSIPSQFGITPSQIGARMEGLGAKLGGVADQKDKNLVDEYKKNNEHLTKTEAGKRELAAKIRYANNHERAALLELQIDKDKKNIDRSAVYEPSFQRFLQARNYTATQSKLDNVLGMNKDVYEESQKAVSAETQMKNITKDMAPEEAEKRKQADDYKALQKSFEESSGKARVASEKHWGGLNQEDSKEFSGAVFKEKDDPVARYVAHGMASSGPNNSVSAVTPKLKRQHLENLVSSYVSAAKPIVEKLATKKKNNTIDEKEKNTYGRVVRTLASIENSIDEPVLDRAGVPEEDRPGSQKKKKEESEEPKTPEAPKAPETPKTT